MRDKNFAMLSDTLEICENGSYITSKGMQVQLKLNQRQMRQVQVFLPEQIEALDKADTKAPVFVIGDELKVTCENIDSFSMAQKRMRGVQYIEGDTADRVLVLNLANPVNPGGGVRRGARAQEEDLCRKSTLLLSLESSEANVYYEYNRSLHTFLGSDAVIITPNVEIIRDENGEPLNQTTVVSVMTCAAPMLRNGYEGKSEEEYKALVRHRIDGMLKVAAYLGYKKLVLGAFGCGAFGNDARVVSDIFYSALKEFSYKKQPARLCFSHIDFAVLDYTAKQYNYKEFARNFAKGPVFSVNEKKQSCTFFWQDDKENGCFSNWYTSAFIIDDFKYFCVEQYMMAQKAKLFHDADHYTAILQEKKSPKTCKDLGKKVTPFDSKVWDAVSMEVVKTANRAKFNQNPELREKLLATGDSILAEASPYDKIWGIGLRAEEASKVSQEEWPGENRLGKILMELREEFRSGDA